MTFLDYVYVCGCVHINAEPTEASDPLEVESKVALSQLTLVLWATFGNSAREICALNCWAIISLDFIKIILANIFWIDLVNSNSVSTYSLKFFFFEGGLKVTVVSTTSLERHFTHKKRTFFEKINLTELQRPFYSITGNFCEAISRQREFLTLKWREQFTGYPAYCTKF